MFWELGTPLTTRHYLGSVDGEMYGLAGSPKRFRLENITSPRTPVPGLILAGQVSVSALVKWRQPCRSPAIY